MRARGFTLIELIIAMALGLMVCLVAFIAFAAASKTVTSANRIALQNRLLMTGVTYAMEDMDTWGSYHPLGDPTNGLLHVSSPDPNNVADARPFNRLRVDPSDLEYRADDPKWWYRYRFVDPYGGWGTTCLPDYSMFGKQGDPGDGAFLHDLAYDLMTTVGSYGMLDYWPPGVPVGGADASGDSFDFLRSSSKGMGGDGAWDVWPMGTRMGGKNGQTAVAVISNRRDVLRGYNRREFRDMAQRSIDVVLPLANIRAQYDHTLGPGEVGPVDWPLLQVATRHTISMNVFFHQSSIKVHDFESGQSLLIAFSAPATTLRGARRLRGLDP